MAEPEESLLRAVLARPDDDPPRRVYASWCESWDPARAELIAAQLDLAALPPDAPNVERSPLERASERLLAAHGRRWSEPVAGIADRWQFDRGFIELVAMPAGRFLERSQTLFARAPIRHLDVLGNAELLLDSPSLRRIRSLLLDHCGLRDEHLAMLAASPNLRELRWLSVGHNHIGYDGAAALARSQHLPELRYVRFFGNPFDPNEQFAHDQGAIVDRWMTEDGDRLERAFGPLRWLHVDARTLTDVVPDRFRI